jgi:hypothetical protein
VGIGHFVAYMNRALIAHPTLIPDFTEQQAAFSTITGDEQLHVGGWLRSRAC